MVALAAQEQKREAFWWRRYVRTGTEAVEHGAMLTARILSCCTGSQREETLHGGFEEEILVKSGRDATADYEVRAREMLLTITRCLPRCTACLIDFLLAALELHYYTLRRCGAPASASASACACAFAFAFAFASAFASASGCVLRVKLQHSS